MQIKVLNKIPPSFIKYFISGLIAFFFDNLVLNIFIHIIFNGTDERFLDLFSIAKFSGATIGLVVSFTLNRNWSFKDKKGGNTQAVKFLMVFFVNLCLSSLIFPIYNVIFDIFPFLHGAILSTIANMATVGTIMFLSYFLYRIFVFK